MEPLPDLKAIEGPVPPSRSLVLPWIVAGLLLALVALTAGWGALAITFQPDWREVDTTRLPVGTPIRISDQVTTAECPALVGSDDPVPPWCAGSEADRGRTAQIAGLVAAVAGLGAALALRRARSERRARRQVPVWPPASYRQDGMPGSFWLAVALVGGLTLLIDWVVIADLLGGDGSSRPKGAFVWTAILATIVFRYGWGKAVRLELDGPDLLWQAPLRTRRIRRAEVIGWSRTGGGATGERPAQLHVADGSMLPVAVPNVRHEQILAAFLATLPDVSAAVPEAPVSA